MTRPNIPESTFRTEGWNHAIICALSHDIWNNPQVDEVFRVHLDVDSKLDDAAVCDNVRQVLAKVYSADQVKVNFISYRDFVAHASKNLYVTCRNDNYRGS